MIKTEAVSRKAQIIDSQFKQIKTKLDYVEFSDRDEKLKALESIYRNLGKALDLISYLQIEGVNNG